MAGRKNEGEIGGTLEHKVKRRVIGQLSPKVVVSPPVQPGVSEETLLRFRRRVSMLAEEQVDALMKAQIDQLLEGFDSRLAVVNQRLDRILRRRAI